MSYVPKLVTVAGVMFPGCVSPGPDLVAITSHAFLKRQRAYLLRSTSAHHT